MPEQGSLGNFHASEGERYELHSGISRPTNRNGLAPRTAPAFVISFIYLEARLSDFGRWSRRLYLARCNPSHQRPRNKARRTTGLAGGYRRHRRTRAALPGANAAHFDFRVHLEDHLSHRVRVAALARAPNYAARRRRHQEHRGRGCLASACALDLCLQTLRLGPGRPLEITTSLLATALHARNNISWRRKCIRISFAVAALGRRIFHLQRAPNLLPRSSPQRHEGFFFIDRARFQSLEVTVLPFRGNAPIRTGFSSLQASRFHNVHRRNPCQPQNGIHQRAVLRSQSRNFLLQRPRIAPAQSHCDLPPNAPDIQQSS